MTTETFELRLKCESGTEALLAFGLKLIFSKMRIVKKTKVKLGSNFTENKTNKKLISLKCLS